MKFRFFLNHAIRINRSYILEIIAMQHRTKISAFDDGEKCDKLFLCYLTLPYQIIHCDES